jgi:hypothetical protein
MVTMTPEMSVLTLAFSLVAGYFAARMERWWERFGMACLAMSLGILGVQSIKPGTPTASAPIDLDRIGMVLLLAYLLTVFLSIGLDLRVRLRRRAARAR